MDSLELQKLKNKYNIIGNDAELNRALETAIAVAPTDLAVLISGESGVGKEVIPQIIHQSSRRRNGKYLAINCGGIPESTINAELFGHEKGSFTGAVAERKGYFEEADGGTLFLDEIAELPKPTQALLLRVLQSGEYMKVGSSKVEKTDVRVIAASNVNLQYAVSTGKFRADLYYRLNGIHINMPSLRERRDDIYLLFRKFSSDFSEKYSLCKISLSHDAIMLLTAYRWPGNIRQLKNVAETVTALESRPSVPGSERMEISADALRKYMPDEKDELLPATTAGSTEGGGSMSDAEKQALIGAIMKLKEEVDGLKAAVADLQTGSANCTVRPAVRAPGSGGDVADFRENEPEEQSGESEPQVVMSMREQAYETIMRTVEKYSGNVKEAARELGISERTIYRKLASNKKR